MRRTLAAIALLSVTTLAACNDNGTGPSGTPNLVGTWTSTAIVAAEIGNSSNTQDLYAEGFRLTFTFQANGNYTIATSFPGEPVDNVAGTYTQSGSTLTLTESGTGGDVTEVTVSISGSNGTFVVQDVEIDAAQVNLTITVRKS